jgi:hypothetical protein
LDFVLSIFGFFSNTFLALLDGVSHRTKVFLLSSAGVPVYKFLVLRWIIHRDKHFEIGTYS